MVQSSDRLGAIGWCCRVSHWSMVSKYCCISWLWMGITMLGGFATHLKAKDPISKAMPALILTIIAIIITIINLSALLSIFE